MTTLAQAGIYIIQTLGSLYLLVVLLRFLLQIARADFYNPVSQAIVKLTNPPLIPLRKIIPGIGGIDLASLVLALVVEIVVIELVHLLIFGAFAAPIRAIAWAALVCVDIALNIFFWGLLVSIIFSWVAPYSRHPALLLLHQLMEPVLSPFRRLLPSMGGLDITPIFAFLAINVLRMFAEGMAAYAEMPARFWPGYGL